MTSERARIALVRSRYSPFGGAERFAQRALAALARGPLELTIIARSWSDGSASEGPDPAVRLLRCDPFYIGSLWRDWSFARAVHRALARERFDLVQSHERIAGLDVYRAGDGVHAVWLERRRAVLGLAGRLGLWLNLHHHYLVAAERRLFEHPRLRAVICNSQMVRDEILARFRIDAAKLHLIPNGVDLERFHPRLSSQYREPTRLRLAIPAPASTFLFVGSGFERKGLAAAIAALPAGAHLIVVGSDKHEPRYRALAARAGVAGRVHFEGEQSDTLPYYGAADAFVLPTIYDPFPNAVLEALAAGLPVITSDGCGARELIVAGQNGWIVAANDVARLAQTMKALADSLTAPGRRGVLAGAARASVEGLGIDSLRASLVSLYQKLLAEETGSRH